MTEEPTIEPKIKFSDFPLAAVVLESIAALGFAHPTEIQQKSIPIMLEGKDMLGMAQTGTGKTAAFVIPLLHKIAQNPDAKGIKAIIITPTRELALQIDQTIDGLSYYTGVTSVAIFGGSDKGAFETQMAAIRRGVDILVATPGRLLQHLNLSYSDVSQVHTFIVDEADKMLDMGFHQDIIKIVKEIPADRQTVMFSATMPHKMRDLAREILKKGAETVSIQLSKPAEGVDQQIYVVHEDQKIPILLHLLATQEIDSMIIFSSSKLKTDEIHNRLVRAKMDAHVFHSDKSQEERMDLMRKFKNKEVKILVATDILSRGIDIDNLSHVVNFDVPYDAEDYIHRIGRTARSGRTGVAITIVSERDQYRFQQIEKLIGKELPKALVPEFLGPVPAYTTARKPSANFRGGGNSRGGFKRAGSGGNNRTNTPPPANKKPFLGGEKPRNNPNQGNNNRPHNRNNPPK